MRIAPEIESILNKALSATDISYEEAVELLEVHENSHEMYALMSVANTLTRRQFGDRGEVYAQVSINLWPCPKSCAFCSFGEKWNVFKSSVEFNPEEVVARAKAFEDAGTNPIFLMTTADYPFDRYIEIARGVRKAISWDMPMIANIGDFGPEEA